MIRYSKQYWGLLTLTKWYGSAVLRALVFSVSSAILAAVLQGTWGETLQSQFLHPYPYQAFAFVAGFIIVFRSNLGYGRFWEGRTQLQVLMSKLADAAVLCVTFDAQSIRKDRSAEAVAAHIRFCDTVIHLVSLLHAVALSTLREDYDLENLIVHDSLQEEPPGAVGDDGMYKQAELDITAILATSDSAKGLAGAASGTDADGGGSPTRRRAVRATHAIRNGRNEAQRLLRVSPGCGRGDGESSGGQMPRVLTLTDLQKAEQGPGEASEAAALAAAVTDKLVGADHQTIHRLKAYRARARRDVLSYFMLRTDVARHRAVCAQMPLSVVGGFSQAEGVSLGAFSTARKTHAALGQRDVDMLHGVLLDDGRYTPAPVERVHTVFAWLLELIHDRIAAGGMSVAPPIQTRVHAALSDAMTGYEHCRKLVDTPFPFPWAQAVTIVLLLFALTAPFLIAAYTTSIYTAAVVTFVAVHTYFMLNEVARDVEDPFHYDPNELQLPQIQYRLNERLLAVSRTTRPTALTDVAFLSGPGNRPAMPTGKSELSKEPMIAEMPPHPLAPFAELSSQHTMSRAGDQTPRVFADAALQPPDPAPPVAIPLTSASPFRASADSGSHPGPSNSAQTSEYGGGISCGAQEFDASNVPSEVLVAEARTAHLRRRVARQNTIARSATRILDRMSREQSSLGAGGVSPDPASSGVSPRGAPGRGGPQRCSWHEAAAAAARAADPESADAPNVHLQLDASAGDSLGRDGQLRAQHSSPSCGDIAVWAAATGPPARGGGDGDAPATSSGIAVGQPTPPEVPVQPPDVPNATEREAHRPWPLHEVG